MKKVLLGTLIMAFGLKSCRNKGTSISETNVAASTQTKSTKDMNSFISIFEIPATDISRAVGFYQEILGVKIERMDFPGMEMGLFPYENQLVTGVILKGEGYRPSSDGVTLYLDGGDDLQVILDKVEENGGDIIIPKTPHADENGYFAILHDSEGNKIGLHSPN